MFDLPFSVSVTWISVVALALFVGLPIFIGVSIRRMAGDDPIIPRSQVIPLHPLPRHIDRKRKYAVLVSRARNMGLMLGLLIALAASAVSATPEPGVTYIQSCLTLMGWYEGLLDGRTNDEAVLAYYAYMEARWGQRWSETPRNTRTQEFEDTCDVAEARFEAYLREQREHR